MILGARLTSRFKAAFCAVQYNSSDWRRDGAWFELGTPEPKGFQRNATYRYLQTY
jgi:hypothetical protein